MPRFVLCYNETESSNGGTSFLSNRLTFKKQQLLVIFKAGKLESTFIEMVLPRNRNFAYEYDYKHSSMKTKFCNYEYLTPLLSRVNKKRGLLMRDLNIN